MFAETGTHATNLSERWCSPASAPAYSRSVSSPNRRCAAPARRDKENFMSMTVGNVGASGDPDVMVDINTTPLIDVMLVLLIMLIITIPIQTHAVKLNMPVGTPPPPLAPPEVVTIEVDFDGTFIWNGLVLPDRADLELRLQAAAATSVQPEIHLRPNKLVKYEAVAAVMASAQRLGLTKIGLIGNEQFIR